MAGRGLPGTRSMVFFNINDVIRNSASVWWCSKRDIRQSRNYDAPYVIFCRANDTHPNWCVKGQWDGFQGRGVQKNWGFWQSIKQKKHILICTPKRTLKYYGLLESGFKSRSGYISGIELGIRQWKSYRGTKKISPDFKKRILFVARQMKLKVAEFCITMISMA